MTKPDTNAVGRTPAILVINMQSHWATCLICGEDTNSNYGVPVHNGDIVSNDFKGEWGGMPVCEDCFWDYEHGRVPTYDHYYPVCEDYSI